MSTDDLAKEAAAWGPTAVRILSDVSTSHSLGAIGNIDLSIPATQRVAEISVELARAARVASRAFCDGTALEMEHAAMEATVQAQRLTLKGLKIAADHPAFLVCDELFAVIQRLRGASIPDDRPEQGRAFQACAGEGCDRDRSEGWDGPESTRSESFCFPCVVAHHEIAGQARRAAESTEEACACGGCPEKRWHGWGGGWSVGRDGAATDAGIFCRPCEMAECDEDGSCRVGRCACKTCPNSKAHGWHGLNDAPNDDGDFCRPCNMANCLDGACRVKKKSAE